MSHSGPVSTGAVSLDRTGPAPHPWIKSYRDHIVTIVTPERPSDEEVASFCRVLGDFWKVSRGRTGVLVDIRRAKNSSSEQRQTFADFQKSIEPYVRTKMTATAFVADSALVRGMLTAIFWIRPPVYKHKSFDTPDAALAWLKAQS